MGGFLTYCAGMRRLDADGKIKASIAQPSCFTSVFRRDKATLSRILFTGRLLMHADLIQHAKAVGGHVLVRGRYATFLTAAGTGYSAWGDLALTRWNADPVEDNDGFFLYLRDLERGVFWSLGQQPALKSAERYESRFTASVAALHQINDNIEAQLEICLTPDADLELRRVTLRNLGEGPRRVEVTSYTEVVINTWAADAAHPAFSKLFVQTEWVAGQRALLARRRPRARGKRPVGWFMH